MNDSELLQKYCQGRCEAAFTELVRRYMDLVYSAALRQVGGNEELAKDVSQSVFIDLARKASSLSSRTVLTGWLYTSTRFAAANLLRAEQRRQAREQEAYSMQKQQTEPSPEPQWEQIRPVLDAAMHELGESDRNAVLLRYFEKRALADVGAKLGLSEDAARMRVGRALEKLRRLLHKRGVTSTATVLAAILAQQTVTAAPVGLAMNIAGTALASTVTSAGSALTILKIMTMTKTKLGLISAVIIAGAAAPLLIQHQAAAKLLQENKSLRDQNVQLDAKLTPLTVENQRLSELLAQRTAELGQNQGSNELLRLRAEVTRLRADTHQSALAKGGSTDVDSGIEASLKTWAARVTQLKQRLEQMPDKKIPELQLVADKDWFDAAKSVKQLQTDDDFRQALSDLRKNVKSEFARMLQQALRGYAQANDGQLPNDLAQLKPYFDKPVEDAVLARYSLLQTGKAADVPKGQYLVAETAPPVDDEYDIVFHMGVNSINTSSVNRVEDAVKEAGIQFAQANNGLLPTQPSQLVPYLKEPIDEARIQKILNKVPPGVTTLDQLNAAIK